MTGKRRKRRNIRNRVLFVLAVSTLVIAGVLWFWVMNKGKTGGSGDGEAKTPTVTAVPQVTPTDVPDISVTPEPTATPTPEPTATLMPTATPTPVLEKLYFPSSESIPVISVKTEEEQPIISRDIYVNCEVTVGNVEAEYDLRNVKAGIRVRGNSSSYYGDEEKVLKYQVPYRIKFEKKQNLLGLNDGAECKSWVLLRGDEGLVRNDIAFRFGRLFLGERYYCSDARLQDRLPVSCCPHTP